MHFGRHLLLALALSAVQAVVAGGGEPTHKSFLGRRPPELVSTTEHWLGWNERLTLAKLRGQVVWLQFNF